MLPGNVRGQASNAPPASWIAIETSPQLFATLCALDAAGFDADTPNPAGPPALAELRGELVALQGPATEALRAFYHEHQLAGPGETLSRYISFALVVGPPPKFPYLLGRFQLPPDVLVLEGFDEVLADFYKEAQLDRRWSRLEPDYVQNMQPYGQPVRKIVASTSAYLREIVKPASGRSFTVYVEPLVGSRINFRNYGEHYAIVVGSRPELALDDIRHAYLHFLLDPLPLRYRAAVESKKVLLSLAARAPRLPVDYQEDFVAWLTECLVRAVELRLRHPSQVRLDAALLDDDHNGLILVRPFVEQLQKFEKTVPSISYYFPELLQGINVAAETQRAQKIEFASADTPATPLEPGSHSPEVSELDLWLAEGDHRIALQDAPGAAALFERVLAKYPDVPRAVYGLAVASVLQGEVERAKELFEKVVAAPAQPNARPGAAKPADPGILAWSHIYLGRIHDVEGDRELALSEYRAALAIAGAPETALVAARRGIDTGYKPSGKGRAAEPQDLRSNPL